MTCPEHSPSMMTQRVDRLRKQALHPNGNVDVAWIIQPENRRYLSGFRATDTQLTESSGSLLISENRAVLVTDSRYTTQAKQEAPHFEVLTIKRDLVEEFPDILKDLGARCVGFESDYLTWGMYQRLSQAFNAMPAKPTLLPLPTVVEEMRETKADEELMTLRAAADLISDIIEAVIAGMRPGMTEKEVAYHIESLAREGGAEDLAFPSIVASGPNSALPHAVSTDRRLNTAEPILLDAGVRLNGYCSDMTRTVFLGEPGDMFKSMYKTVRKAQLAAINAIYPAVKSTDVDRVARHIIEEAGYGAYFGHGLGHGVGLAAHERPRLSPRHPVPLKEGMVVTVEPGIYIPETGGVRLEEMVWVTPTGE